MPPGNPLEEKITSWKASRATIRGGNHLLEGWKVCQSPLIESHERDFCGTHLRSSLYEDIWQTLAAQMFWGLDRKVFDRSRRKTICIGQ